MGVFRKNGNFWIDYYIHGRRKREMVGPDKALAVTVLRKRKVQIAEEKFLDIEKHEKILFRDFAVLYADNYAKKKRSWKDTDRIYLKNLAAFFGHKYLSDVTSMTVQKYRLQRQEQRTPRGNIVSVATVNRELSCLRCLFGRAIEWEYLKENPVKKIKFEKENNRRVRFLEKDELKRLLDVSKPVLKAVILLAVNTGMRRDEIRTLKWRDIDIQRGIITLRTTKNGETRRVPLNSTAKEVLLGLSKHPEGPYVFYKKDGTTFCNRQAFETALRRADIQDFRFHDLRHTAASYLAMAGVDLNTIREILGHKTIDMVLRYAHLSPEHRSRAIGLLDAQMVTVWTPDKQNLLTERLKFSISHLESGISEICARSSIG